MEAGTKAQESHDGAVCEEGLPVDPSPTMVAPNPIPLTRSELQALVSERHMLRLTPEEDELLDPIERTVRYLVPIPKQYYWQVLGSSAWSSCDRSSEIPLSIRMWHHTIASCDTFGQVMNDYVGQPLASLMGLNRPRFFEVIESMTAEEMEESARRIRARKDDDDALRRQKEQPAV